jgi:hypothetical protein
VVGLQVEPRVRLCICDDVTGNVGVSAFVFDSSDLMAKLLIAEILCC